jgi:hypothetical protein
VWMGLSLSLSLFFFFCVWGTGVWTQGPHLELLCQHFTVKGFSKQGLVNYLPGLVSNHDPWSLSLE